MSKNWDKVTAEMNLISLPDVYWRLKEILPSRDYSIRDIGQIIMYDPGLTVRLLRIVNSAYFGFSSKIETVNHALSILGVRQIEELILTTSVANTFGSYECEQLDMSQFWRGSVYRAITARELAGVCNLMDGERMFVAGLLSGIGHLVMYQSIPQLAHQAKQQAEQTGESLYQVEREVIGFDHVQVAARLMENWKLPDSLIGMIKNHLQVDTNASYLLETSIAHIAAIFGNAYVASEPLKQALSAVDSYAWGRTGLNIKRCEASNAVVEQQLGSVVNLMFPNLKGKAI